MHQHYAKTRQENNVHRKSKVCDKPFSLRANLEEHKLSKHDAPKLKYKTCASSSPISKALTCMETFLCNFVKETDTSGYIVV